MLCFEHIAVVFQSLHGTGPQISERRDETSACCEQCEGSVCCERRGHGREEPDGWRKTGVVDWVSNVSDILRCCHDDDAGCKQSGRGQVQELRGAMRETSAGKCGGIALACMICGTDGLVD